MRALTLAACLAGCGTATPQTQDGHLAEFRFVVPSGWKKHQVNAGSREVSRWVPESNDGKESISLIRTALRSDVHTRDSAALLELLGDAQRSLPHGQFGQASRLSTSNGMRTLVVAGDFEPAGTTHRYHRVHALVIDGSAVVHVLYTAETPDPDLKVFHAVVDSLHREEG